MYTYNKWEADALQMTSECKT